MGITVVTGEPRSGTSLMMNVLKELGCDILGSKFPAKERGAESKRVKRAQELNPEGFWEVPGLVARGGRRVDPEQLLEKLEGKTVKLISRAMLNTPKEVIDKMDKIIFCARNPREIMESQKKLVSQAMIASEDDWKFVPEMSKVDYSNYKASVGRFILAMQHGEMWNNTLIVDYHDMLFNTEEQIKRIADYLEVPYKDEAAKLIRNDLYRSKMVEEYDKLAMDLYKSIIKKDFSKVEKSIKKYMANVQLKRVRWLDDTEFNTWVIGGWDLHRSLITNNKNVRDKLQATANINSLPINDCMHYNPTGEEYTIRRVKELPDITRTKIKCSFSFFYRENIKERPEEVTRERCYNCWQGYLIKKSSERNKKDGQV